MTAAELTPCNCGHADYYAPGHYDGGHAARVSLAELDRRTGDTAPDSWQARHAARVAAAERDLARAVVDDAPMTDKLAALAHLMYAENDQRAPNTSDAAQWLRYDETRQRRAAEWYLAREDTPTPSDVAELADARAAWRALADIVAEQYRRVTALGLVHAVSYADAYADVTELVADVNRGQLVTLASDDVHPFWTVAENDAFRFVHDALGHAAHGLPFDRFGEDTAYRVHAATLIVHVLGGQLALGALASETRGQNGALVYGPDVDGRPRGTFARQACHVAPGWLRNVR